MRLPSAVLAAASALVAFLLVFAGAASADPGHKGHAPTSFAAGPQEEPDRSAYRGLQRAEKGKCAGGYQVRSKDKNGKERASCTHGPDPAPPQARSADQDVTVAELQASAPAATQAPSCDTSDTAGMRVQAIYSYPADRPSRAGSVIPLIRQWAAEMDDVFLRSARETGGSRRIRFVTEPDPAGGCRISVKTLQLSTTGDDSFGNTLTESHAAGYTSVDRRFLHWTDTTSAFGTDICGIGELWNDDRPGQENLNNGGNLYDVYPYGLTSRIDLQCWGVASQSVEAHELAHNFGAVQQSAPNKTAAGHCVDEYDLMCYPDGAGVVMDYSQCTDPAHDNRLDCNHDDYFHTSPATGSYLDLKWNTARVNFLREGGLEHESTTLLSTQDGDMTLEPGESFSFDERVRNQGAATATKIGGALSSPSSVVTVGSAKPYPNVGASGTAIATSPFTAALANSAPCGAPVPLTVTLTSSQGTQKVGARIPTGEAGQAETTSASPGAAIDDNATTTSSIALSGTGRIRDIDVRLDVAHAYVGDLTATLTSPDGTTVQLFEDVGGAGTNFTDTVFDDEAATSVVAGAAPFTGSYRPESPLSAFDGETVGGTWTLAVSDGATGDTGTLSSWGATRGLAVCNVTPPPPPPPVPATSGAGWSSGSPSARGDFNGDGRTDLAVASPGEDVGSVADAGAVHVLLGSATGLSFSGGQVWTQDSTGIPDAAEAGDGFGGSLASGDFNGDGRGDLAIGVPGEDVGASADAGQVHVVFGSPGGLSATGTQARNQDTRGIYEVVEPGDGFGATLAAGDLNGDRTSDLAIGVPREDVVTRADAGAVNLIPGSATGLTASGNKVWSQDTASVPDVAEDGDSFGASLAVGDLGNSAHGDLAVGAPGEGLAAGARAGTVHVLFGSGSGLNATGTQQRTQDSSGIPDAAEAGDGFGSALAAGDVGNSVQADLVVGVADEDVGTDSDAGTVHVIFGSATGLTSTGTQQRTQDTYRIPDEVEPGDRFGAAVAVGDLGNGAHGDVAIGAPGESVGAVAAAGVVQVIYGSASGLVTAGAQLHSQDTAGIPDAAESGDRFGSSVAALDLGNAAQADLVIGAPSEDAGTITDSGALHVVFGSTTGLTTTGTQLRTQDTYGVADTAEPGDGFGSALGR